MRSDAWAALGAWANVLAVIIAAGLAAAAWREQRKFSRAEQARYDQAQRAESNRESVRRVGAAISDLTTGSVAQARAEVASWTSWFSDTESGGAIRGERLEGKHANEEVRNHIFVLLWAIQRLAPVAVDIGQALPEQRRVLRAHIGILVESLSELFTLLDDVERDVFRESAKETAASIVALASELDPGIDLAMEWSVAFSSSSLRIVVK